MALFSVSFTTAGLNYVVTALNLRARGTSMMRLPDQEAGTSKKARPPRVAKQLARASALSSSLTKSPSGVCATFC